MRLLPFRTSAVSDVSRPMDDGITPDGNIGKEVSILLV